MRMTVYYIKCTLAMSAFTLMLLSGFAVSGAFIWMTAHLMMELKEIYQGWALGGWLLGMTAISCLPAVVIMIGALDLCDLMLPRKPRRRRSNPFTQR